MNPSGNLTPAQGTPASILSSFQAANPLHNVSWKVADSYRRLYNSLNVPDLLVQDIVAIQTHNSEAQTISFNVLKNYGISETDQLYLHLERIGSDGVKRYEAVGASVQLVKSVGNDAEGKPNYLQALINLIQAQGVSIDIQDAPALLFNISEVRNEAASYVQKFIG